MTKSAFPTFGVFSPGFSGRVVANLDYNICNCYVNEYLLFCKNYRAAATALKLLWGEHCIPLYMICHAGGVAISVRVWVTVGHD